MQLKDIVDRLFTESPHRRDLSMTEEIIAADRVPHHIRPASAPRVLAP
jgi:hypothetical protein